MKSQRLIDSGTMDIRRLIDLGTMVIVIVINVLSFLGG